MRALANVQLCSLGRPAGRAEREEDTHGENIRASQQWLLPSTCWHFATLSILPDSQLSAGPGRQSLPPLQPSEHSAKSPLELTCLEEKPV